MNRPITNKDDLEMLIDELGLKTVLVQGVTIGSKGWQSLVFIHLSPQKKSAY
jgi:hypothetical protein